MGIRLSGTGKNWAVLLEGRLALLSRVFFFSFFVYGISGGERVHWIADDWRYWW